MTDISPIELRRKLLELTQMFFVETNVQFSNKKGTKPLAPFITLKTGSISKSLHSIKTWDNGVSVQSYPSHTMLEVNLYTNGTPIELDDDNYTTPYENSAVNDMAEFCNFLDSPEIINWLHLNDLAIRLEGEIHDLSFYLDGIDCQYKAMAEFVVDFTQTVAGAFNIRVKTVADGTHKPNSSGGGSAEMAAEDTGYFIEVQTEKVADEDI